MLRRPRADPRRGRPRDAPTNSESPVSNAHGSGPRSVSISANGVLGPAGVCTARTTSFPSASSQPSSKAVVVPGAAARWMWMVAPVEAARRPCLETWSAWLWVSSTCSMRAPR
jgi:hypothetical protein